MTMENPRTKAKHGREDGRKENKKTERLLEPGRTSGPPSGSSGLSRIIRTLPRIIRVTAMKTPEGFHQSRIIRNSIRIIRTPDARMIRDPVLIIRPCLRA